MWLNMYRHHANLSYRFPRHMERHDSLGGRPKFQFTDISQLGFALFTVLSPVYIYRYTTFLDFSYNC